MSREIPEMQHRTPNIESLNVLLRQYGKIPWGVITEWYNHVMPAEDRRNISELLLGNPTATLDISDPNTQAYLYYIYALRCASETHYVRYFREINERLRTTAQGKVVRGAIPVYFGLRGEDEALGKSGDELKHDAAVDFAQFMIGASFRDIPKDQLTELFREDLWAILDRFPIFKKITKEKHIDGFEIERVFEKIDAAAIALLIGYFRKKITFERRQSAAGGINAKYLSQVRSLLHILEEILTKRIAAEIKKVEDAKLIEKLPLIIAEMLHAPLRNGFDKPEAAENYLTTLKPPEAEGEKEHAGFWHKATRVLEIAGAVGAIIAGILHVRDILRKKRD